MRKQINPKHRTQSQFWIRIQSQQIPDYGVTRKKKLYKKKSRELMMQRGLKELNSTEREKPFLDEKGSQVLSVFVEKGEDQVFYGRGTLLN